MADSKSTGFVLVLMTWPLFLVRNSLVLADEYNSCDRQARSKPLPPPPCHIHPDANYCATPGSAYPWQSLIKFVNDHRGLMTRMYGDMQQSVLLRKEIKDHKIRVSTSVARSLQLDQSQLSFTEPLPELDGSLFPEKPDNGRNACPSRTEVLSPYWANTTRGELVAVLNVYPFEQYLYFDKCTDEHRQMACRDGCRCEQHFGLQRLLVFDPRNECRGIFSDWFRFPSCCVCRCYDPPLEDATAQGRELGTRPPADSSNTSHVGVDEMDQNSTDFSPGE